MAAGLSAIETSGAQEKRPELSRRTDGWRSEAPAGWGCPARLLRSSRPVSSQPHVSRPERQVTPPTPAVTRALADNGTISRSTSAPETPCHRPGSCATPARAGEQWMRGTWSSGCSGAVGSPARWSATPAVSQAGWVALHKAFEVGDYCADLGLLKHNLRDPNPIGIDTLLPWQIGSAILVEPAEHCILEIFRRQNYKLVILVSFSRHL